MKKVKFGIIGAGNIGAAQYDYFMDGKVANAELVAIADLVPEKLEAVRKKGQEKNPEAEAKITYFNAAGDEAGKISLTAPSKTAYEDGISLLKGTEAAETIGGVGASASEEADKALWNTRISCAIGDDTFNVSLNRDSIVITGYAKAETLEAIENWADTVDALA